jgi:hypothetical protein
VVDGLRLCALCRKRKKGLSVGGVWEIGGEAGEAGKVGLVVFVKLRVHLK